MALKMAVVVDYQNVHLTAAGLYMPGRPPEDTRPPALLAVAPTPARRSQISHCPELVSTTCAGVLKSLP